MIPNGSVSLFLQIESLNIRLVIDFELVVYYLPVLVGCVHIASVDIFQFFYPDALHGRGCFDLSATNVEYFLYLNLFCRELHSHIQIVRFDVPVSVFILIDAYTRTALLELTALKTGEELHQISGFIRILLAQEFSPRA